MAQITQNLAKTYRKHFIPLESNPEVFTELIHKLGVSPSLVFQDVLSLDDADLLAFLPRPAYALVLVFPTTEAYERRFAQEEEKVTTYEGAGENEDVVYFKQTIHNACGLYAILHGISNGEARGKIAPSSLMEALLESCVPLKPDERALALEDSTGLEEAYASVARKGDTEAPASAEDKVDYHYICFVKSKKNGHLFQLDGDRKGPIDLGAMADDEDVLSEKCLRFTRDMVAREGGENIHFSLMALVPEQD